MILAEQALNCCSPGRRPSWAFVRSISKA